MHETTRIQEHQTIQQSVENCKSYSKNKSGDKVGGSGGKWGQSGGWNRVLNLPDIISKLWMVQSNPLAFVIQDLQQYHKSDENCKSY